MTEEVWLYSGVVCDATGEIVIGTIPCLMTAIRKSMDPDSVAGVPGGMAVASRRGSGWVVRDILEHDGSKVKFS